MKMGEDDNLSMIKMRNEKDGKDEKDENEWDDDNLSDVGSSLSSPTVDWWELTSAPLIIWIVIRIIIPIIIILIIGMIMILILTSENFLFLVKEWCSDTISSIMINIKKWQNETSQKGQVQEKPSHMFKQQWSQCSLPMLRTRAIFQSNFWGTRVGQQFTRTFSCRQIGGSAHFGMAWVVI